MHESIDQKTEKERKKKERTKSKIYSNILFHGNEGGGNKRSDRFCSISQIFQYTCYT